MLIKIQKKVDSITTAIGAILIAVMFVVIMANVVLRLIPNVGGFKWYMEFSQYANVWAMLIGAGGIAVSCTNLRVELIDSLVERFPWGRKLTRVIIDVFLIVFYVILTYSGYELATRAKQAVSTMPSLVERFPWGRKLTRVIIDVFLIVFYVILTYSGYELATRAKQAVSTMPQFTMGQVYMIFPVAGVLCIICGVIHLLVTLTTKEEGGEVQ